MPDITVSFDSDEPLARIEVEVTNAETATMDEGDFAESGAYTYTGTYAATASGTYDFELTLAEDYAGNAATVGQTDSVVVSSGPPGDDFTAEYVIYTETAGNTVRIWDIAGASGATLATIASAGLRGVDVDRATGDIYVPCPSLNKVVKLAFTGSDPMAPGDYTQSDFLTADVDSAYDCAVGMDGATSTLYISLLATGEVRKVPLAGGTVTEIHDSASQTTGISWDQSEDRVCVGILSGAPHVLTMDPDGANTTAPFVGLSTVIGVEARGGFVYGYGGTTVERRVSDGGSGDVVWLDSSNGLTGTGAMISVDQMHVYCVENNTSGGRISRFLLSDKSRETVVSINNARGICLI